VTLRLPTPAHLAGLDRYEPGKPIEDVQREFGLADVVKLASNENPLGPSPKALAAVAAALSQLHRYPDGAARKLREAIAARHGLRPENVVIGNGSTDLIDLSARAFLGPDDDAVVSEIAFARFRQCVFARNRRARVLPMRDVSQDLPGLCAAAGSSTRLAFVANPNNPTGTWHRTEEVESLFAALPAGCVLVHDEAYFEYACGEPGYPDSLAWVREERPVLVLRTFSKAYGLAGLRVGYGLAPAAVVEQIECVREPFNANLLAQAGALAALDDVEHVRKSVALNAAERSRIAEALRERGLRVLPSLANFLCVDAGCDATDLFRRLLQQGVIVRPLGAYPLPTWLRISIGALAENDRLLAALAQVLPRP
jgi:histidinol-phosphate aminotransferase